MTAEVETALYTTWQASGASQKVLLALFEAGIVESGMRNLDYGDRDSLGVLQQRASWGSKAERMSPTISASKFINKAKTKEKASGQTAGQLAQAVQVSAFPGRYDAVAARAQLMIAQQKAKNGSAGNTQTVGLGGGLSDLTDLLTDPALYRKIALYVLGFVCVLIGLVAMVGVSQVKSVIKGAKVA
jgi:hypothetical protein